MTTEHITKHAHTLSATDRSHFFKHSGGVLWLTGLSAAGKSTLAMNLEKRLHALGYASYTLDGDNLRTGLNSDLGFSESDRGENIRRVGEVASLFADAGLICIAAFISPYRVDRDGARAAARNAKFCEVYVDADLASCEERDPKGLYKKASKGEIPNFTGIGQNYEVPKNPDLHLKGDADLDENIEKVMKHLF
jgi:adenylyl-sulfate kinase